MVSTIGYTNITESGNISNSTAENTTTTELSSTTLSPTTLSTITGPYFRCSPDWGNYKDEMCYKVFDGGVDYGSAGERCRSVGGNLVSITSLDKMNFITSLVLLTTKKEHGFWIGLDELKTTGKFVWNDGSSITVSNWSPNIPNKYPGDRLKCAYVEGTKEIDPGKWSVTTCNNEGGYICERPLHSIFTTPYAPQGCKRNTTAWQWGCYWFIESPLTFSRAVSQCSKGSGKPVWFENSAEFNYIKSLIGGGRKTYWTGLQRKKNKFGAFSWSDNSKLRIPLSLLHLSSTLPLSIGKCGALEPKSHDVKMKIKNCTDEHPVICKNHRRGYPVPGLTQPRRKICPHKSWITWYPASKRICVKVFVTKRTWKEAKKICQSYGADLLKITNSAFESYIFGKVSRYNEYWIGLSSIEQAGELKWTDGTALGSYTDWSYSGKPKTEHKKKKMCATLYNSWSYSDRGWKIRSCSRNSKFVCAMKQEYSTRAPPTSPLPPKFFECDENSSDWYSRNGFCYYLSRTTKDKKSWHDARTYCRNNHGELASIHSQEENHFILRLIRKNKLASNSVWLGLNGLSFGSKFEWSDQSVINFLNWGTEPEKYGQERCAVVSELHGEWRQYHCNKKYHFACKKLEGATSVRKIYTPPPLTGYCPRSWKEFGSKCYKIFTSKRSWRYAMENCQKLGPGHYLASISNVELQRFLTVYSGNFLQDIWIGLNDRYTEGRFYWADNSEVTYTNWAKYAPAYNGDCVIMRKGMEHAGQWKDTSCYNSKAYMCERFKDPTLKEPQDKLETCEKHKMFVKYRTNCYRVFSTSKENWDDARATCLKYDGDLASFHDIYETFFISNLMAKDKPYWIGLSNKEHLNQLKWSSRYPVTFSAWNATQVASNLKKDSCVVMQKDAKWRIANCSAKRPFVCEIHKDIMPPLDNEVVGVCPAGWLDIGTKKCYSLNLQEKSWSAASFQCTKSGATLASFHSNSEMVHVFKFLRYSLSTMTWIGLYKDFTGGFKWLDETPVQFVTWEKSRGYGDCVLVNASSIKWFRKSCTYSYPFLCMIDKNITILPNTAGSKSSIDGSSGSLTGGQKAVIAVVVIVIICAIVAGVYYFLKIRQRRKGMSDASHSFTFDNEMYNNNNL